MRDKNRYPVKEDLNLAQKERRSRDLGAVLPTAIVLAVLIGLFCKFLVIDRLSAVTAAEVRADQAEAQLAQLQERDKDYDQVLEKYQSYTLSQSVLAGGADPMDCLALIQSELMDKSQVSAFTVSGDTITAQISGVTLNQISAIYSRLMAQELVSSVQVYTASTAGSANTAVTASMTIRLNTGDLPQTGEEEAAS